MEFVKCSSGVISPCPAWIIMRLQPWSPLQSFHTPQTTTHTPTPLRGNQRVRSTTAPSIIHSRIHISRHNLTHATLIHATLIPDTSRTTATSRIPGTLHPQTLGSPVTPTGSINQTADIPFTQPSLALRIRTLAMQSPHRGGLLHLSPRLQSTIIRRVQGSTSSPSTVLRAAP